MKINDKTSENIYLTFNNDGDKQFFDPTSGEFSDWLSFQSYDPKERKIWSLFGTYALLDDALNLSSWQYPEED